MKSYLIYGALSGGFGGKNGGTANFEVVSYCKDKEEAMQYAYEEAKAIYQSYEGNHGLVSEEDAENIEEYEDNINSWIEYDVIKEVEDDFDIDEYLQSDEFTNEKG